MNRLLPLLKFQNVSAALAVYRHYLENARRACRSIRPRAGVCGVGQVPVLVKGIEKSRWRSLFSDVLRTTTTSAGRVSLFFSRTPEASYNTWNTNGKLPVSQYCPSLMALAHCLRSFILHRINLDTALILNPDHLIRGKFCNFWQDSLS